MQVSKHAGEQAYLQGGKAYSEGVRGYWCTAIERAVMQRHPYLEYYHLDHKHLV